MNKKKTLIEISEADIKLFRDTMALISPIKYEKKIPLKKKTKTTTKQHELVESIPSFTYSEYKTFPLSPYCFARPGIQKRKLTLLKKGQLPLDSVLDLHGYTVKSAEKILFRYINMCLNKNFKCVKIIHGKGSPCLTQLAPIKNMLYQWLEQHPNISAYATATLKDGGLGATYILIKK